MSTIYCCHLPKKKKLYIVAEHTHRNTSLSTCSQARTFAGETRFPKREDQDISYDMVHKRQETTSIQRIEVLQIQGTGKRRKKALKIKRSGEERFPSHFARFPSF